MSRTATRIATLAIAATVASLGWGACPATAQAETYEELQQRVEKATADYDQAVANVEKIQKQIEENEGKIAQLEADLPAQRKRAAESIRTLYKMQQSSGGLIDLILSADDFNDFISTITYLEHIQNKNFVELDALTTMAAELQEAKDTLAARHAQANHEVEAAQQAQNDAIDARDEMVRQAIAQAQAEAAQVAATRAAVEQEAEEGKTFVNASGQETELVVNDTTDTTEELADTSNKEQEQEEEQKEDTSSQETTQTETKKTESKPKPTTPSVPVSDRDAFVSKWAPRIDAYLGGSPLGGYGRTFAEAAYDYGVDPRWSPAISCIESGKGTYCFRSHNAWGWGSVSWPDWDTAIRSHVAGLSAGYGYTLTMEAAEKYCESGGEWYYAVQGQMSLI